MADTVIDALLVTLSLDAKKFGSGAADATERMEKFRKTVAGLGVDEGKLDDKQKRGLASLTNVATQSQRTRKELAAASGAGVDFWGIMKTGALGFGAALGLTGLKSFVSDTTNSVAATGRLAKNIGSSTDAVTKWGRAVAQSVGGDAAAATGTLKGFHDQLLQLKSGLNPQMMQFFGMVTRYSGMSIQTAGKSEQDVLLQLGEAAQKMGPEKASMVFGQAGFDQDTINFLELGRKGMQAALESQNKTGASSDADSAKFQDLQNAEEQLKNIVEQASTNSLLLAAPDLTLGIKNMSAALLNFVAWYHYERGDISDAEYKAKRHENNVAVYGFDEASEKNARDAANSAHIPLSGQDNPGWFRRQLRKVGVDIRVGDFDPAVIPRIKQLTRAGLSVDDAAKIVKQEVLSGHVPSVPNSTFGAYGPQQSGKIMPVIQALTAAIPKLERSGDNAVSPAGAVGRYQIMPANSAHYGIDPTDPKQSELAAQSLLTELYIHYKGDIKKTLAGYNWGQTKLDHDIAEHGAAWRDYLPKETEAYISRPAANVGGDVTHNIEVGDIHVHTSSQHGQQIAQDIRQDLKARSLVTQSTSAIQ